MKWIKNNTITIIGLGFLVLLCYGHYMFSPYYYHDEGVVLHQQGTNYNWLGIGRYGLVLIRLLFKTSHYSPYFEAVMFLTTLTAACLAWCYLIEQVAGQELRVWIKLLFAGLFITYPLLTEQFYFQFQSFEIVLGYLITAVILYLLWVEDEEGMRIRILAAVLLSVLLFGIYQAFVNVYLTGCIGIFLFGFRQNITRKKIALSIKKYALTFLSGFLIYELLCILFFHSDSYLTDQIGWGNHTIKEIIFNIAVSIGKPVLGYGAFYSITYLPMCIGAGIVLFLLWRQKKVEGKRYFVLTVFTVILFFTSPFFLSIATGMDTINRAQLALPLQIGLAFAWIGSCVQKSEDPEKEWRILQRVVLVMGGICLLFQVKDFQRIVYTHDILGENSKITATELGHDLNKIIAENGEYPIAIIGSVPPQVNAGCCDITQRSEVFTSSLFMNADIRPHYYWSTLSFCDYWKMYGVEYTAASEQQIQEAKIVAEQMKSWPSGDGIQVKNGVIVVKLSEQIG